MYEIFKTQFIESIAAIKETFENAEKDEYKFEFKWVQNVKSLNNL